MALKLGSLYVSLSADASGLVKGLGEALKSVERFSREVKKASADIGAVGLGLTAFGGAALRMAADVDKGAKNALDNLSNSMRAAAVPIAQMLIPAVNQLALTVREVAGWIRSLDPDTKQTIATFARWGVEAGAVALVLGRLSGLIGVVAGAFKEVAFAVAGLGLGPLAGILAVVAAIAVGLPLLHQAWRENWLGIQETTRQVIETISGWWHTLVAQLMSGVSYFADKAIDVFSTVMKAVIDLQGMFGQITKLQGNFAKDAIDSAAAAAKSAAGAGALADLFKSGFEKTKEAASAAAKSILNEWKLMFKELGLSFPKFSVPEGIAKPKDSKPIENKNWYADKYGVEPGHRMGLSRLGVAKADMLQVQQQADAAAKKMGEQLRWAAKSFVSILTSKMGEVGSIISSAVQGAQSGGIWGAVIAVILELVSRTKGFTDFMDVANGTLKQLTDALGPLVEGIFKAIGKATAVGTQIILPIIDALQPLFEGLAEALDSTIPILSLLGTLFKALAPVIKAFATIIGLLLKLFGPVLRVIFEIVRVVLLIVLYVLKAIVDIWNWMVEAIAKAVDAVVSFFTAGADQHAGNWLRENLSAQSFSDDLGSSINELANASFDAAQANADQAVAGAKAANATNDLANNAQKVNESFQNIPTGYKVALARFNADNGGAGGGGASGGGPVDPGALSPLGPAWHEDRWVVDTINITTSNPEDTLDALQAEARRRAGRATGSPRGGRGGRWG